MQVRKIIIALIVIIVLCFLNFCEKVVFEPVEIVIPDVDTLCFNNHIQPIFTAKCVNCHGGIYPPNLSEGVAYNELIDGGYIEHDTTIAETSLIYTKLLTSPHDSRATLEEKQLILVWLKKGAKEVCD